MCHYNTVLTFKTLFCLSEQPNHLHLLNLRWDHWVYQCQMGEYAWKQATLKFFYMIRGSEVRWNLSLSYLFLQIFNCKIYSHYQKSRSHQAAPANQEAKSGVIRAGHFRDYSRNNQKKQRISNQMHQWNQWYIHSEWCGRNHHTACWPA